MNISVIGAGYVGLTTAACLAEMGHAVFCTDSDDGKLDVLREMRMPFYEPHLAEIVAKNSARGTLRFVDSQSAIQHGKVLFICVGTPPLPSGEADLSAIEAVATEIIRRADGYRLVVEKSTVPVQTARRLRRYFSTYQKSGVTFDVASNPEFLREGSAVEDFFHPDRIVVGADGERAVELMREIYRPIVDRSSHCPVHRECTNAEPVSFLSTDTDSSELIKHASNSFLAMKISYINMIANLCEATGADIEKVARGIGLDRRIGSAFLRPGIGFGGFCFPKDLQAFVHIAENFGCDFSLLKEVERINRERIERLIDKIESELWVLRAKTIAVWGLAFKPNTDDVRFAPSIEVIRRLIAAGVRIRAYDPQATKNAKAVVPEIAVCDDPYETAHDADAILLLTEWQEFRSMDWQRLAKLVSRPVVFDGRNYLNPADAVNAGFDYFGTGMMPARPSGMISKTDTDSVGRNMANPERNCHQETNA